MPPKAKNPMLLDSKIPESPRQLIYSQIDRLMLARSEGKGGAETLSGLLSLITPYKDAEWFDDMRQTNVLAKEHPGDERVIMWHFVESVVRLLDRKNMWVNPPRDVPEGQELTQAV